jgi:predicted SAM-dependent methyltransferase
MNCRKANDPQGATMTIRKMIALYPFQAVKRLSAGWEAKAYLKTAASKKLNIGAQTNILPGWLNVDLLPFPGATFMDATRRWPFPDNTFDALLCEHMIEHVSKREGQFVLNEAYRVAADGARIRIVTPDMTSFARLALDQETRGANAYIDVIETRHPGVSQCDIVNMIYYGYGHRYIFSPRELSEMMRQAGFVDIQESRASFPINSTFKGAEGHPHLLGAEQNAFEAFALEATKTGTRHEDAPADDLAVNMWDDGGNQVSAEGRLAAASEARTASA